MTLLALVNMKIHGQIFDEVALLFGLEFAFVGLLAYLEMLVTLNFIGYLVDVKAIMAAELLQGVCFRAVDD